MNRTLLIGRIVRDVQLKQFENDSVVMNNVLAINRIYKHENQPSADFIPFVVWGKRAALIEKYCEKGDLIALEGRLQSRSYEDKSGEVRYVIELVVDHCQFLQPKKEENLEYIKELSS